VGDNLSDKKIKFSIWYVVAALIVLSLVRTLLGGTLFRQTEEISYSAFKTALRAGQVKSVSIGADRLRGAYRDEKTFTAVRLEDPGLLAELDAQKVETRGEVQNKSGVGSLLGWLLPLVLMGAVWYMMFSRMKKGAGGVGGGLFSFGKSKARIVQGQKTGVTFKDVGGIGEAIADLSEVVEFLENPDRFQRLGGRMPKGVLLVGPPGTGKTLMARAMAGEAGVPFFSLSGSEFVEMFVGVGASRVRDLFDQAKKKAPSIVFIDEIDAVGSRRAGTGFGGSNEEREQTLNQLLAEMDGFEPSAGVILVAATNRPEVLDPALLRPGRFDRQIAASLPDLTGREEILRIHTRKVKLAQGLDLLGVARITPGFSGADLANVVNEAALLASRRGKESVESADFDEAIEKVLAGSERRSRAMNPREKQIVAVHEAGHALVASHLPGTDPVHKISIVPRGRALGYTWQRPTEDRYLLSESELKNRLSVLLGGRVAEALVFHEPSTGAADDLNRATDLARKMVTEYGMSLPLGPVRLAADERAAFLGGPPGLDPRISPATAAKVDEETRRIIEESVSKAWKLLEAKRRQLDELAERLFEKETVEAEELKQLIAGDGSGKPGKGRPRARQAKLT